MMVSIISYWEMQTKTTVSYHNTPIRMAKMKTVTTSDATEGGYEETGFLACGNVWCYNYYGKQIGSFL